MSTVDCVALQECGVPSTIGACGHWKQLGCLHVGIYKGRSNETNELVEMWLHKLSFREDLVPHSLVVTCLHVKTPMFCSFNQPSKIVVSHRLLVSPRVNLRHTWDYPETSNWWWEHLAGFFCMPREKKLKKALISRYSFAGCYFDSLKIYEDLAGRELE